MLNLLIVDDEIPFLRNLSDYLGSFKDEFAVLAESTGEKALEIIKSDQPVDVLLSDIRLPGIDGIELVRQSMILRPSLKVLVMTAYPSSKIRTSATSAGALRYMEKPLDLGELHKVLLEAGQSSTGWSGTVGGLDIFDVTQLLAMSGRSMAVRVTFGERSGTLMFRQGRLAHASAGDLEGEEAFFEMARWSGGTFEEMSRPTAGSLPQNVEMPFSQLMIEAARHRDEENERLSRVVQTRKTKSVRPERQPSTNHEKELVMNITKVEAVLNNLKEELGSGLLATDIWAAADGQAIAGVNSQPAADALFNELWDYMQKVLKGAKFPTLDKYIYLDLTDDKAVLILSYGKYRHGILLDSEKVKMGLLLNVYVPQLLEELPPALA